MYIDFRNTIFYIPINTTCIFQFLYYYFILLFYIIILYYYFILLFYIIILYHYFILFYIIIFYYYFLLLFFIIIFYYYFLLLFCIAGEQWGLQEIWHHKICYERLSPTDKWIGRENEPNTQDNDLASSWMSTRQTGIITWRKLPIRSEHRSKRLQSIPRSSSCSDAILAPPWRWTLLRNRSQMLMIHVLLYIHNIYQYYYCLYLFFVFVAMYILYIWFSDNCMFVCLFLLSNK